MGWYQKYGLWIQTHSSSNPTSLINWPDDLKQIIQFFKIPFYKLMKNIIILTRIIKGFEEIMYKTHNRCLRLLHGHRCLEKVIL